MLELMHPTNKQYLCWFQNLIFSVARSSKSRLSSELAVQSTGPELTLFKRDFVLFKILVVVELAYIVQAGFWFF